MLIEDLYKSVHSITNDNCHWTAEETKASSPTNKHYAWHSDCSFNHEECRHISHCPARCIILSKRCISPSLWFSATENGHINELRDCPVEWCPCFNWTGDWEHCLLVLKVGMCIQIVIWPLKSSFQTADPKSLRICKFVDRLVLLCLRIGRLFHTCI